MEKLTVTAKWDEEAEVWVATSDDVPGLITEAETVERLIEKLQFMIPELMHENGQQDGNVPFNLLASRDTQAISCH